MAEVIHRGDGIKLEKEEPKCLFTGGAIASDVFILFIRRFGFVGRRRFHEVPSF